ncbi:MAG: peroxiredoxin [Firmicutes bacterium]|nr:peroxiredoxin [Bacillota bacterium]
MPEEFKPGCQRPPIKKPSDTNQENINNVPREDRSMLVKVGKSAPKFVAPGFYHNKFMNFSLEEYLGKWVLLCFYPGDFTFV